MFDFSLNEVRIVEILPRHIFFTREKHIKEPLLNHHQNVRVVNKIFWWYIFYIRDTAACLLPSMYCKTSLFYWQFGLAAKTNASQKQWIELGDLSRYSCIVKPSLCGATGGGSISFWIKTQGCTKNKGILSSMTQKNWQGLDIEKNDKERIGYVYLLKWSGQRLGNTFLETNEHFDKQRHLSFFEIEFFS